MANFISNSLTNLMELFGAQNHKQSVFTADVDVSQIVEHVVDIVDPKMRVISRYSQKLIKPVEHTWGYLNEVADEIPGGLLLSRHEFDRDPRLKIIFESKNALQQLLDSALPLLKDDGTDISQGFDHIYMLLCMDKKERNFLGAELAGEIIKRDVKQTLVTFNNHKILSASRVEENAKQGFKQCVFEGLLRNINLIVMHSHKDHKELVEEKKRLRQQLQSGKETNGIKDDKYAASSDYLFGSHPELLEIERKITHARIKTESPEQHLTQVIKVLNHPERYLEVNKKTLVLNGSGIKSEGVANKSSVVIDYAEVEIESSLKHITMVAACPAKEIEA